jgi:hypothetical protein
MSPPAAWWLKIAGTGDTPFTAEMDRWQEVRPLSRSSRFPRRPSVRAGDRMVVYAAGSARDFGEGRLMAVVDVLSDPEATLESRRWPWAVEVEFVAVSPRLSRAPTLRDISVSTRSLGRHSHIRLTDEQGERALRLFGLEE